MKKGSKSLRIGLAIALIVGVVAWLAISGFESNKSYYVTIPELSGLGAKAFKSRLRVEGFVVPGSIVQKGTHVEFVLNQFESHAANYASGRTLRVSYTGAEPPPDTFVDDAQALAEGRYGPDGLFHATGLQAKCASKYAPAQPGTKIAAK